MTDKLDTAQKTAGPADPAGQASKKPDAKPRQQSPVTPKPPKAPRKDESSTARWQRVLSRSPLARLAKASAKAARVAAGICFAALCGLGGFQIGAAWEQTTIKGSGFITLRDGKTYTGEISPTMMGDWRVSNKNGIPELGPNTTELTLSPVYIQSIGFVGERPKAGAPWLFLLGAIGGALMFGYAAYLGLRRGQPAPTANAPAKQSAQRSRESTHLAAPHEERRASTGNTPSGASRAAAAASHSGEMKS